jgi:galactokinase
VITAFANGRVNLIGEHTDYNDGWVFPTAIPQRTRVTLTPRSDRRVVARTTAPDLPRVEYELGSEKKADEWFDYLQGATSLLLKDGFAIRGFDIDVDSNVPMGSGLSSSAAFEIAVLKALREAFTLDLNDESIARLGQRIENDFVGARVGIMDQMACAIATFGEALFLDTMTLKYERVPIPLYALDLVVINSGIAHRISGGGYNQRRAEWCTFTENGEACAARICRTHAN